MANKGALGVGIFFLLIGGSGFLMPNSVWNEGSRGTQFAEMTIPELHDLCSSGLGQLGQAFSGDIQKGCSEIRIVAYGIYGSGIIGLILIIVGAVVPGKNRTWTCKFCNYATSTEAEMINHKNRKHLEKTGYICEHCAFIGRTEGELLDHYNDKHPNEKKW